MSVRWSVRRLAGMPVSTVLETGYAVFVLYVWSDGALFPGAFSAGPAPLDAVPDEGNLFYTLLHSTFYVVALVLLLRHPRGLWRLVTADLYLVALLGMTMLSFLWSGAPDVTLRRSAALLGTSLFGVYLTRRYTTEEQLRLLGWALGLGVLLNLIHAIGHPDLVSQGEFRGWFIQKNVLGRMMAFATLVFLSIAWAGRRRSGALLFAALSLALMIMARSATAIVVLLTVVSLIPLFRMLERDARLVIAIGIFAILLGGAGLLLAASHFEALASVLGRDTTLTGRTDLWPLVVAMILRRLWIGYGYESFWLEQLGLRIPVYEAVGWEPAHSHNGFLEVGLALGLIGLFLFAMSLVRGATRAVRWARLRKTPSSLWPLVYLSFLALYNVTENTALARNTVFWVFYVASLLSVSPSRARATQPTKRAMGSTGFRSGLALRSATGMKPESLPMGKPPDSQGGIAGPLR